MKRFSPLAVIATVMTSAVVLLGPTVAHALTKEQIFSRCIASLKKEFGEAEAEFKNIRRTGKKEWAFGTLEMTDGSKHPIRCQIRNRRIVNFKFRTNGTGTDAWSPTRPANAGYIEAKNPETPEPQDNESQESVTETPDDKEEQTAAADPNAAAGAPKDPDGQPGAEAKTDPDVKADTGASASDADTEAAEKPADTSSDGEETAADPVEKEEPTNRPVFRKVKTK